MIIIIMKKICTAPIFHTEWKHRTLYNSNRNTYTHTHAHTQTHAHAHTHTHTTETKAAVEKTDRFATVLERWVLRASLNDEEESELRTDRG